MSDLRPTGTKITLGGKEYGMRFTLNAIDDIQEHFGIDISDLSGLFAEPNKRIKSIRYLLTLLINEDIDCVADETGETPKHLDERYVGRHIDATNIQSMMNAIMHSFSDGAPKRDDTEDETPNSQSE
jgi:hypothetical protein